MSDIKPTTNNSKNSKNILFDIFKRFESGPSQFVVAMFAITVILVLTIGIPVLSISLNYNRALNELSFAQEAQSLTITETTLLTMQEALANANRHILELEHEMEEHKLENIYLQSLLYFTLKENDIDLSVIDEYNNFTQNDNLLHLVE